MSARLNIGLTFGVLVILIISATISIMSNQSVKQLADNVDKKADRIQAEVKTFISNWESRQRSENWFNNQSEHQLLDLQKNASQILKQQIANEQNIQGNLSSHRIIANLTYDKIFDIENKTSIALNQTNQLVKFLADNFGTKSGYLDKENFQYDQANKTFENTNKTLGILNNQTR